MERNRPKRRIGHQMREVIAIVQRNPGCNKKYVAEIISPYDHPEKSWRLGYNPINRAIRQGLIRAIKVKGGIYQLFAVEAEP